LNDYSNNGSANAIPTPDEIYHRGGLSRFLERHGFHLSRALGQHFLISRKTLRTMLDTADLPKDGAIIEIGPGVGHLTWQLLERGLSVVAIEKDNKFSELLQTFARRIPQTNEGSSPALTVIHEDALEMDFARLAETCKVDQVIGNLPYNVSVPILFRLAYCAFRFRKICVLLQKEVGERIWATPGGKSYGRLSIVLKYLYHVRKLHTVYPDVFFPRPKVESVFIEMAMKPEADIPFAQTFLERVVRIGFLHRRKKMRKQFLGAIVERRILDAAFMENAEREFNFDQRAEEWDVETWVRFGQFVQQAKIGSIDS
jgi:16S rRNA (adenine1518-N6/adenine1519-N6)-dimethyltransferase